MLPVAGMRSRGKEEKKKEMKKEDAQVTCVEDKSKWKA